MELSKVTVGSLHPRCAFTSHRFISKTRKHSRRMRTAHTCFSWHLGGGDSSEQVWTDPWSCPADVTSSDRGWGGPFTDWGLGLGLGGGFLCREGIWGRDRDRGGPSMVKSKALWAMFTWNPLYGRTDTNDWKHYLPRTSLAKGKNRQRKL